MEKKTFVITEQDGEFQVENNGISEFALIGVLECIIFNLKTTRSEEIIIKQNEIARKGQETVRKPNNEVTLGSKASELRNRIRNAVKAIKGIGGNLEETDLSNLTEEELQAELEELTNQYKRLKSSKSAG